jgi:hypothetical protein
MIDFSFSVSSGCGVLIYSSSLFSVYKRALLWTAFLEGLQNALVSLYLF